MSFFDVAEENWALTYNGFPELGRVCFPTVYI